MDSDYLINTPGPPSGGYGAAKEAFESLAYFHQNPYPRYSFGAAQWPAVKGAHPTPLPYARILVDEGAEFLFSGGPPTFAVTDAPEADALLTRIVRDNGLNARYVALATRAAHFGTVAAKFSFDPNSTIRPVRIAFLSVPDECRVWVDPHDQSHILMVRIQYPYRDPSTGEWLYFREEWTEDFEISYRPKPAGDASLPGPMALPGHEDGFGDGEGFEIAAQVPNLMGVIPVGIIRNRAQEGTPLGLGDLWGSFRLMDRIALTLHGEDRANQMHSDPTTVALNAELAGGGLIPGETVTVKNTDPNGPPADVKLLEPTGAAREYSHRSLDKWEELLYKQVGLSRVDPAAIGNKGNLTRLALMTSYARTVATSDRKRTLWGEAGLAPFFRSLLTGLANLGGVPQLQNLPADLDVTCAWPDYFAPTDQDISDQSDRAISQVTAGILPRPRAAERVALAEGVPPEEIDALLAELAEEDAAKAKADKDALTLTVSDAPTDDGEQYAELGDASGINNMTA